MNSIRHIRESVLRITQIELAEIAGTTQGTVSRWEKGTLEPDRDQLAKIREAAIERGIEWRDSLFFSLNADSAA
jgi:transcriptional regulator with XRE-family HTH domain